MAINDYFSFFLCHKKYFINLPSWRNPLKKWNMAIRQLSKCQKSQQVNSWQMSNIYLALGVSESSLLWVLMKCGPRCTPQHGSTQLEQNKISELPSAWISNLMYQTFLLPPTIFHNFSMDFAVSESLDLKYEPTRSHQLRAVGKGDSISKNYLNKTALRKSSNIKISIMFTKLEKIILFKKV